MPKGKGKNKRKSKARNMEHDTPAESSAAKKEEGERMAVLIHNPANSLDLNDTTIDEGEATTNGHHVRDPVNDEGEVEDELHEQNEDSEKGKNKDTDIIILNVECEDEERGRDGPSVNEAASRDVYIEFLVDAAAILLDPESGRFDAITNAILKAAGIEKAPGSDLTGIDGTKLLACRRTYDVMENYIRPQTASAGHLKIICQVLAQREMVQALTPVIDELRWNR